MGFRLTPVVRVILIINVAVYLLSVLIGSAGPAQQSLIIRLLGMHYFTSDYFFPWQLVTYMFTHASLGHIFGNMLGLIVFGPWLEQIWGEKRFIQFYAVVGVGAMLLYSVIQFIEMSSLEEDANRFYENPTASNFAQFVKNHGGYFYRSREFIEFKENYAENEDSEALREESLQYVSAIEELNINRPMVGASGAVLGIVAAFALLFPNTKLFLLFPPIPIKAKYIALLYAAFDIYGIVVDSPSDNVAHYAHIGGLLFGWMMVVIFGTNRNDFY